MAVSAGKLAGGMLLLVGVWISVYWWWQPGDPKITFSNQPAADGAAPTARIEPPDPGPRSIPTSGATTPPVKNPAAPTSVPVPAIAKAPAPTPQEKPATEAVKPPEFYQYRVQGGETLQTISKHFYGSPDYASVIARANPLMDPTKLKAGREILIPRDRTNIQGLPQTNVKPAPAPASPMVAKPPVPRTPTGQPVVPAARTYKVQEGDTLSEISQKFYGTHSRTKLLYEANRDKMKSENDLKIGAELVIPEAPAEPKKDAGKGAG